MPQSVSTPDTCAASVCSIQADACVDTPRVSLMSTARVPPGKLWLELGTRGQPWRVEGWTHGEGVLSPGLSRSGCTFLVLPTFRPPLRQHALSLVTASPPSPHQKRPRAASKRPSSPARGFPTFLTEASPVRNGPAVTTAYTAQADGRRPCQVSNSPAEVSVCCSRRNGHLYSIF